MKEHFIQKIILKNVRNIKNFEIPLNQDKRTHLIITGKNGSGKTTTLIEINNLLNKLINNQFAQIENLKKSIKNYHKYIEESEKNIKNYQKQIEAQEAKKSILNKDDAHKIEFEQIENHIKSYNSNILNDKSNIKNYKQQIKQWEKQIDDFSKVDLLFSNQHEIYEKIVDGSFLLAFFEAKRKNIPTIPSTITKQNFQDKYQTNPVLNQTFVQYMVNINTEKMFAKDDGDNEAVEKINRWFTNFENSLKELFDEQDLKLVFYRKDLNFKIEYDDKSFGLDELSDGYSSVLAIVTELILRMEAKQVNAYDMQGVVLIDEIETHLHVALQKRILPFLINFFPKIQFIVTTHSPFVLSSLENTVICDLEKKFITTDLSSYSYDALIESYFDSDKYSQKVKDKIDEFEKLSKIDVLKNSEKERYYELKKYFKSLPTYMSDELDVKINQILLSKLGKQGI